MESFSTLKRRTTGLLQNVHQNLPSMPQMPNMPNMPHLPQMPAMTSPRKDGIPGTYERIDIPPLPRSAHSLNIISGSAYIFGGEATGREPVDNDMHVVTLPWSSAGADYYKIKAVAANKDQAPTAAPEPQMQLDTEEGIEKALDDISLSSPAPPENKGKEPAEAEKPDLGDVPPPRIGHATAVIGSRIFLFGGRGGPDLAPLEEAGRVWVFDTRNHTWSYLDPVPAVKGGTIIPHPFPRSHHCAVATDRPRDFADPRPKQPESWQQWALGDTSKTGIPQDPIVGNVAEDAVDEESDGYGTFFVHGGCLAGGERNNDIWAFDVHTRQWTELPAAPGPGRSGSAICISKSRLYRFGGYDGEKELGEQLDFLHLEVETFDDKGVKGEVCIRARGGWQTVLENNADASSTEIPVEPIQTWPGPRCGATLQNLTLGSGHEYLVLAYGEREPGSEDDGATAKYYDDIWLFQVPPVGMTPASVTAAMWQAMGRKTGEGKWSKIDLSAHDDDNDDGEPTPRGWVASAPLGDVEENALMVWGGLGENNKQYGDGWILRLGQN